jgi:hypothetical protein
MHAAKLKVLVSAAVVCHPPNPGISKSKSVNLYSMVLLPEADKNIEKPADINDQYHCLSVAISPHIFRKRGGCSFRLA